MAEKCECCGQLLDIRDKPVRGKARRYYFDIKDLREPNLPIPFRQVMTDALNVGEPAETPQHIIREMRRFRQLANISMEDMGRLLRMKAPLQYNSIEAASHSELPSLRNTMLTFNALGVVLVPVKTSEPDPLAWGVELKRNKRGKPYPQLKTSIEGWKKRKANEKRRRIDRKKTEAAPWTAPPLPHPDEIMAKAAPPLPPPARTPE